MLVNSCYCATCATSVNQMAAVIKGEEKHSIFCFLYFLLLSQGEPLERSRLEIVNSAAFYRAEEQETKWEYKVRCAEVAYTELSLNWVT